VTIEAYKRKRDSIVVKMREPIEKGKIADDIEANAV
jgi:hypothetical protein